MQLIKYSSDKKKKIFSFTMDFRKINKNNKSQNKPKEKYKAQIAICARIK